MCIGRVMIRNAFRAHGAASTAPRVAQRLVAPWQVASRGMRGLRTSTVSLALKTGIVGLPNVGKVGEDESMCIHLRYFLSVW